MQCGDVEWIECVGSAICANGENEKITIFCFGDRTIFIETMVGGRLWADFY